MDVMEELSFDGQRPVGCALDFDRLIRDLHRSGTAGLRPLDGEVARLDIGPHQRSQ
jgi:hypothetical protein